MSALIFDTEVNSLDAKEVVELAYATIDISDTAISVDKYVTGRFRPNQPFEAGAVAVHYIMPQDVDDCPPSSEATLPDSEYIIAHNVDFDCEVMKIDGRKRICTLAISRHLWPQFKSHTLSSMFLELYGIHEATVQQVKRAHSAAADVDILVNLLRSILAEARVDSLEQLYRLSERARIPDVMPFGKHKGVPLAEVPRSYFTWLLGQPDVDPYLVKAIKAL